MGILSFITGLLIGIMSSVIYFWKKFSTISNLLADKLFINDLLKKQVKDLQSKSKNSSKKYYRRKNFNKKSDNASKQ